MLVPGQGGGDVDRDHVGVPHKVALGAPELHLIVAGNGQLLGSQNDAQSALCGRQRDNIHGVAHLHQHSPFPSGRDIPGHGEGAGQVVELTGDHFAVSLNGPVVKADHALPSSSGYCSRMVCLAAAMSA